MQSAIIDAPASKSLAHRFLIAAGLAAGESRLDGVPENEDVARTIGILRSCGVKLERTGPGAWRVQGLGDAPQGGEGVPLDCDVGESGTACRLFLAVLAAGRGLFRLHGQGRMHSRPVNELAEAVEKFGAKIRYEKTPGCPPLLLEAKGLEQEKGRWDAISCAQSSQYLSGLLLAAPLGTTGLRLTLGGEKVVSWPYVGLTLQTLELFGLKFRVQARESGDWRAAGPEPGAWRIEVEAGRYRPGAYKVEGDFSGASYFLAAGAIGPRPVSLLGLRRDSLQGDRAILDILSAFGARVEWEGDVVTVSPRPLRGVDLDMGHCPDLVPTVAALAAHARGATVIRNAAHLRLKESDRLAACAVEFRKAGCVVMVAEDGLVIAPPKGGLKPASLFCAHSDHRMAMSLALLGLTGLEGRGMDIKLDNPDCVNKSFPQFWTLWNRIKE